MSMTEQEMTADLVMRALEVLRLSALVSTRGLAHAHANWFGHTQDLSARIQPADSVYQAEVEQHFLGRLELTVKFYEFMSEKEKAAEYQVRVENTNAYIHQLQEILDSRQPVLQEVAA